jgi:transcriptional regulator with XRE-family HTH domain
MKESTKNKVLALVASKIKLTRKATGISQENFARKVGIDRAYYGRIESGRFNFSIYKLLKIADALDVDLEEICPKKELRKLKLNESKEI